MRFWRLWRKLYRIVRVNYKAYLHFCVMLALRGVMRGWNFTKLTVRIPVLLRPIIRVEPALSRFCLRCCSASNDQTHCNSHQDRLGCTTAVPGQYDFPNLGISCS